MNSNKGRHSYQLSDRSGKHSNITEVTIKTNLPHQDIPQTTTSIPTMEIFHHHQLLPTTIQADEELEAEEMVVVAEMEVEEYMMVVEEPVDRELVRIDHNAYNFL
jgi:hypothetical protein